jgi:eukaryotic-like serine/threonine-protein kinase
LGRGGMGVFYKAWQIKAKRAVSLKMIPNRQHASLHEKIRFQIETEAVTQGGTNERRSAQASKEI